MAGPRRCDTQAILPFIPTVHPFICMRVSLQIFELTPKGQMVFFEFWSRSHGMSIHPNFLMFLRLVLLFEIYVNLFSKLFVGLEM